jgi:hypothetical protein
LFSPFLPPHIPIFSFISAHGSSTPNREIPTADG